MLGRVGNTRAQNDHRGREACHRKPFAFRQTMRELQAGEQFSTPKQGRQRNGRDKQKGDDLESANRPFVAQPKQRDQEDKRKGCKRHPGTREACSFRDQLPNLPPDTVVLGVSTDSVNSHLEFARKHGLSFPLLADEGGNVAKSYGVLSPLGIAHRVTFIINPQGVIVDRLEWVNWWEYAPRIVERLTHLIATANK